mmetsp:Transcript_2465/g.5204  ORF Transcript_2465/g.5204 Transcript_2465/m.5204 type:complete len:99 (-) Transcript_2465:573-869(-)
MMRNHARQVATTFFLLALAIATSAVVAISSPQQQQITKYEFHHVENPTTPSSSKEVSFLPVVYVSVFNAVTNMLRPDPAIIWQVWVHTSLPMYYNTPF